MAAWEGGKAGGLFHAQQWELIRMTGPAFVSVVTPVYNGGKFLDECIDSVRAQRHAALEHVILDNASSDDTPAIATRHSQRDRRVRVHRNDRMLPMVDNWNRAIELISPNASYCWLLPADDLMYPHALERMLEVALRHPTVGIVGSLRRRGDAVECAGLPEDRDVFPGREIGRLFLEQRVYAIAPTTNLMRADLVRARRPFYPTRYFHEDIAAFLDLLRTCDFGFVHDVLAFSRPHAGSMTATVAAPAGNDVARLSAHAVRVRPRLFRAGGVGAGQAAPSSALLPAASA